jgi:glucosyl-dolichyl phosphate glucuronosyltransferase
MIRVSVIICTFDRADHLRRALEALTCQTALPGSYEIIVVDNSAGAATSAVVQSFASTPDSPPIRWVHEARPGLGPARNRGIAAAGAQIIAFTDDDALPASDWIARGLACFDAGDAPLAAVGGRVLPLFEETPPEWYDPAYEEDSCGSEQRPMTREEWPSGNNMFIHADVFRRHGGFDVQGMAGDRMAYGEETAFFERVRRADAGVVFLYCPHVLVRHLIPPYKTTVGFMLKRSFNSGQAWVRGRGAAAPAHRLGAILLGPLLVLARTGLAVLRAPSPRRWRRWLVEEGGVVAWESGRFLGALGINPPFRQRPHAGA